MGFYKAAPTATATAPKLPLRWWIIGVYELHENSVTNTDNEMIVHGLVHARVEYVDHSATSTYVYVYVHHSSSLSPDCLMPDDENWV
jgi:hypothetical protein